MNDTTPVPWEIILRYFPSISAQQKSQFQSLYELYAHWNARINVISRKDSHLFYERHVLHSLAIAKVADFQDGTKILDVGTGGGFPGIPLAILFPKCQFHLIDSIGKKIKVAQEVSKAIGLTNVIAVKSRMEQGTEKYDVVVTRAVARLAQLKQWLNGRSDENSSRSISGLICLKGGDLTDEIRESGLKCEISLVSDYFSEPFFETKKVILARSLTTSDRPNG